MSEDGAHFGITAERALATILGDAEQPDDTERATPAQVRARIEAAVARGGEPTGYSDCADMVAGMVLRFYETHPAMRDQPIEATGQWADTRTGKPIPPGVGPDHPDWKHFEYQRTGPDLYAEVVAFTDGKLGTLGITGFQWGWACNAARYALDLPPEPNPAILLFEA